MNGKIDLNDLVGRKPFLVYPAEVDATIDPQELIKMALECRRLRKELANVYQFVFVVEGGAVSKFLQIKGKGCFITEFKGDARKWPGAMKFASA